MVLLAKPLESVDAYVEFFTSQPLPVLKRTVRELDALRADMDTVSGKRLAAIVLGDPLMTMKLLTYLQAHRRQAQNHDITTIDRAIMMMGLEPFFRVFSDMPTLEDALAAHPRALIGVLKVIGRARKAAHYARDWAVVRHDLDVDEITVAALLVEASEIVCWTFAPALTERVYAMQRADRSLRSVVAQREVFGVTAQEIQQSLIRTWQLPALLVALMDAGQVDNPRVRNVLLATDFARHVSHGWDDAALPDDLAAIEQLIHLNREPLLHRLGAPEEALARFLPAEPG
ncbi:HDOD domain-containing protein [Thauera sp. CAU 1555]|uniref:HDOD domain-containing protein n=1 Tax=Thauera sedimentorum TaxID=2767595 RepID=A0ABR9B931_9RHOO|nr:HDOD domain-containing protein [Thauera sedimentorum]MBC9071033.1 HDOD domain-containing protein [Thauera sedimentorum]MBD8501952.1 HDOD domain-containing protein [Thauera sedimentorum]